MIDFVYFIFLYADFNRDLVQNFNTSEEVDKRIFCWGNGKYTAKKLYNLAFSYLQVPNTISLIWKSKLTPRVKFFAWLILLDQLNTRNMLVRRHFNVQPNALCVMCQNGEETINHPFFDCSFDRRCWDKLGIIWRQEDDIHRRFLASRQQSSLPFFTELALIAAWVLW